LAFSFALHGSAQTKSGSNRAAAEALFNQGRDLMTAGKFVEACPKFEASQQLDPGLGTMLNLAECYEKTGRTASAWAEYREAIPLARAAGSKARQDLAVERAKALEERLSTLTIRAIAGERKTARTWRSVATVCRCSKPSSARPSRSIRAST
jgi:thioredoxin-like negative regulator of GroEL